MTRTQLISIQKETARFLQRKTSTKKGVYEVREKTKESLYRTLKLQDDDLTVEDIDDFYTIIGDEDSRPFLKSDIMGASALEVAVTDAVSYNDTINDFLRRIETFMSLADNETREKAIRLYKKYVEPKVVNLFENEEELELSKNFNLF